MNYNTREEIAGADGLLTFDGVYQNVYENSDLLIARTVILFIVGNYIGSDNSFDKGMPPEKFCTWQQLEALGGLERMCEIGWHTWSHRDLRTLSDEELEKELTPPWPMRYLAYPYGRFDDRVIKAVKKAGFEAAFAAGKYGDGSQFQIMRKYL